MSDETEQARLEVVDQVCRYAISLSGNYAPDLGPILLKALDAYARSVRADVFSEVEAEARRRHDALMPDPGTCGEDADQDYHAACQIAKLADWCQQQKGQG